jgi:uncharacterized membrane protein YeiB
LPLTERVAGFDVARALAILGMVIVHFSLVMAKDYDHPRWLGILLKLLDGRAATVFVVLAGVGITLMSRRAVESGDLVAIARVQRTLVRRGWLLLAIGFLNLTIWQGDILRVYGISLMLASGLLTVSNRRLLLGSLGFAAGFVVLFVIFDFGRNWDWSELKYHDLWTPLGIVRNLFYDGFRSVWPWTGFILFGMWLGRLDLRNSRVNACVFLSGAVVALAAETVSHVCVARLLAHPAGMDADTIRALFGTESMPALPLFLLASGGEAVAVIALCVRLVELTGPRCWWPLAATGQMALTWYLAHILLGLGTIVALDLVNTQSLPVAAACGVGFFATAVALSCMWKAFFRNGPLEAVLRRLAG